MSQSTPISASSDDRVKAGIASLKSSSYGIIAFGLVLLVLGLLAMGSLFGATIATVYFVGVSMIAAGVAEIVMGYRAKSWSGFLLWIILGALYLAAGVLAFANPLLAAGVLTLVLGASLAAAGLMRIILALQMRAGEGWLLLAVSGAITLLLGWMILAQWPISSLYVLGLLLSIDLIFTGLTWVGMGAMLSGRR